MKTVTPSEAFQLIKSLPAGTYAIVDVRSPDEFAYEHIEGSINIPLDTVLHHAETLRAYQHVFLYCRTGNRSGQACATLAGSRMQQAASIQGGIGEMKNAGFTAIRGSAVLPLQQQVFITVGSIVLTGSILTLMFSAKFVLIPLAVSFGLLYAGVSGNCMMAKFLMLMPWNRKQ